jgi:hypothetical protein
VLQRSSVFPVRYELSFSEREREKKVGGGSERHYRLEGGVTET